MGHLSAEPDYYSSGSEVIQVFPCICNHCISYSRLFVHEVCYTSL